ncbi:MAG TPA: DUF4382 domain-containing protein [Anaeromyxobacter sp.]|nr:DUF4382 domain-containing protein [Anaeromyxobacter sp.]
MKAQVARVMFFVSLLVLSACGGQGGSDTEGKGQVSIVLSSGAASAAAMQAGSNWNGSSGQGQQGCAALQAASVTFSAIVARTLDGTFVDVTIALPDTVDLLSLVNGKTATLPAGFLPPGTYDQFVVVMRSVDLTLGDGTKIAITPPGGGWTAIVQVAQPFTVVANQTTTVTLKFRSDLSFVCGLGGWEFHPDFEADGKD